MPSRVSKTAAPSGPPRLRPPGSGGCAAHPAMGSTRIPHLSEFEKAADTEASPPGLINKGKRANPEGAVTALQRGTGRLTNYFLSRNLTVSVSGTNFLKDTKPLKLSTGETDKARGPRSAQEMAIVVTCLLTGRSRDRMPHSWVSAPSAETRCGLPTAHPGKARAVLGAGIPLTPRADGPQTSLTGTDAPAPAGGSPGRVFRDVAVREPRTLSPGL